MKYNENNKMSEKEKRLCIDQFCVNHSHDCSTCIFYKQSWCDIWGAETIPSDKLDGILKQIFESYNLVEEEPEPTPAPIEYDPVNKPEHYCREGAMECIEEMITLFGIEAVKHFCLCNAWKYRYRSTKKNGEEDLEKSDWYVKKYKELSDYGTR